ncbi:MAG: hypothetical protein ACJ0SL_03015 [Candidatus Rariloculaceae bacterium]
MDLIADIGATNSRCALVDAGGEGVFTLEFDHYETTPGPIQKRLESDFRPAGEA